jgi:hypothetical protein
VPRNACSAATVVFVCPVTSLLLHSQVIHGIYIKHEVLTCARRKGRTVAGFVRTAAVEQDPRKLIPMIEEINRLLEAKEQRLDQSHGNKQGIQA